MTSTRVSTPEVHSPAVWNIPRNVYAHIKKHLKLKKR